ncbi:M24 family metallopeptidase [Leucobacter soli]|uniref:M24 family metallopeptidase n=1 Tax=Leucobacter soli TaxID=2812850 RepID=UPI00361499EC
MDPCGVYNHYHANVAATFFVGEAPEEALEISAIQAGAYELLCQTARVGTPIRETNRVLKEYYEDAGTWGSTIGPAGTSSGSAFRRTGWESSSTRSVKRTSRECSLQTPSPTSRAW